MRSDNFVKRADNMSGSAGEPEDQEDSEIPQSAAGDVTRDANAAPLAEDSRGPNDVIAVGVQDAEMENAEYTNESSFDSLPIQTIVNARDSLSTVSDDGDDIPGDHQMTSAQDRFDASPSPIIATRSEREVVCCAELVSPQTDAESSLWNVANINLRAVTSQMECATVSSISIPPLSTELDQSLEVEKIDKLKLSSSSLTDKTIVASAGDDVKDSFVRTDSFVYPVHSQCHDSCVSSPSTPPPPLTESLCCVAGVENAEMEGMASRLSSEMSDRPEVNPPAVVVSEEDLAHGFTLSSRLKCGRSLDESFGDRLADEMAEGGFANEGADLSPLQHPNPYPIPHLDSPEDDEGAFTMSHRLSRSADFDSAPPSVVDKENEKPRDSAPLFERGISPSSVKQNRSATFSSTASSPFGVTAASIHASPPPNRPDVSPDASPRPALAQPSTPGCDEDASQRRRQSSSNSLTPSRNYDYILKFLLVGDSDVGKDEILSCLSEEVSESPYDLLCNYKTTTILIDGKRVKLQLWDTSGQGRFCTILRSYSRGAQGILLVYDITNKWSFDGIDRWLKEVDEHAPGVPKILVGNRLHLAYKRQVCETLAEHYASKNDMAFFEVSPLCDFNIVESFTELSRVALQRNGMARLLKSSTSVSSLQDIAIKAIVARTTVYSIDQLPLPGTLKQTLKSYSIDNRCNQNMRRYLPGPYAEKLNKKSPKPLNPSVASPNRGLARIHSCVIS